MEQLLALLILGHHVQEEAGLVDEQALDIQPEHVLLAEGQINVLNGDGLELPAGDAELLAPPVHRGLIDTHPAAGLIQTILAVELHGACLHVFWRLTESLDVGFT